ncbi:MAG TPA: tRNA preQ1(34) S-adenosylmethionine ribosyltransferase-isomerase QueA [Acholeplasmataceae bacterium]|nr:tRNA preQ1(34) S-adenosylmethionine ribosyltransferase-isomerase QueA [Acholeplasmataceae bacterium]
MKVEEFDYYLPEELIAQTPLPERTASRLLVVDRKTGELTDTHFYDIINYLVPGDVLVLNNTKVLPARIFGRKTDTGANIEVLLLKDHGTHWEALVRPARRVKPGTVLDFSGLFQGEILAKDAEGLCKIWFHYEGIFLNLLEKLGKMPLPPYIHEELRDQDRYQTVYAKEPGSAAAPTAGLHFDEELLARIKDKGVTIAYVTLHIGLGTFRTVNVENVEEHHMHSEHYTLTGETADLLNRAKAEGRRIIAVGTTSARTLEAVCTKYGSFREASEETDIFIYPGYQFKAIDALITNFHLPKSTLVMLVSAFYSREGILKAYQHAIEKRYRFFSFGDAMFLK